MIASALLCPLPHDRPREVLPGAWICAGHRTGLDRDLKELPGLYDTLAERLTETGQGADAGRISGTPTHGLDLNEAAADHRIEIQRVLAAWAMNAVVQERGVARPPSFEVRHTAPFLRLHLNWIVSHRPRLLSNPKEPGDPIAPLVADEVRAVARRAWGIAYPLGIRRMRLGPCLAKPEDGEQCQGTLWLPIRPPEDSRPTVARCDGCGIEHQPAQFRQLGAQLRKAKTA